MLSNKDLEAIAERLEDALDWIGQGTGSGHSEVDVLKLQALIIRVRGELK